MELKCVVKAVAYRNETTNWGVFVCEDCTSNKQIKVVGISIAREGQEVTAIGQWALAENGEHEFRAESISIQMPASTEGLKRFLGSGVIPGVGRGLAQRMIDAFGDELLDVITNEPVKLLAVPGISRDMAIRIGKNWKILRSESELMVFLATKGVSPGWRR